MISPMFSLLDEVPYRTLGYPLNEFFKIIVYFIVPYSLTLILYLTLIASDIGLVCYHFVTGNPRWATTIIIIMYAPSVGAFIFTLVQPERWPSEKALGRGNLRLIALHLGHLIGFPIAAIYRYIHQIFWGIEALCANCVSNENRRENALRILIKPNSLELYFFLQAYLHSAPQIFFQFYLLFTFTDSKSKIASIQVLSIVTSLIRMAITTAAYQRFERRKVLGTYYPWASKRVLRQSSRYSTIEDKTSEITQSEMELINKQPTNTALPLKHEPYTESDDEIFLEPVLSFHEKNNHENDGFDKLPMSTAIFDEVFEDADEITYRKKVSLMDNPEIELRRTVRLQENENNVKHITPPLTPAPRPISLAAIKENVMQNIGVFVDLVDKIPQRRYKDEDLDLPLRIRRSAIKGIEQEDGVSKLIAFFSWFFFLSSRMLVISTFAYFYPSGAIYICIAHYIFATLMLMINSWSENANRKFFYLFLGYIYIYGLLEFKMKFKKVRLWYGLFFILVFIENFAMSAIWYWTTDASSNWWFGYIIVLTIGSNVLSSLCFLLYFLILKPKPVIHYPKTSMSISPATVFC